ncbi:MAG: YeiH family protein [Myxococcota bacterium]|nr:YeiH family protein [Myxococcota bacterium]
MNSLASSTRELAPGLAVVALLAGVSTWGSWAPPLVALKISPLIVGILLGTAIGNIAGAHLPPSWSPGITFSAKKVLRLAIILYGFRITFSQVAAIGIEGVLLDVLMVTSTLILGAFLGTRFFGLDKETTLLTSAGAAICGAAAVIATEPVVRAKAHQTALAVGTVVLFGTLSMFLYPIAYRAGLVPLSEEVFGVYIGASVHEVAHVVGAGEAVSPLTADTAVIVKMTRVMLLAPALLVLSWVLSRQRADNTEEASPLVVPWFAVGFIAVAGLNSLSLLPQTVVEHLITLDTFLLTMAMSALGLTTVLSQFKGIGWGPIRLAFCLALWLVFGGYALTCLLIG